MSSVEVRSARRLRARPCMASRPRKFEQDQPVLVTKRCVWRLDLMEDEVKAEYEAQLVRWADYCRVEILAWVVMSNHVHLLVRQGFTGHDPERKRGIAAFCRNVNSATARRGNAVFSVQGHFVERAYRSRNLRSVADLVRALAYVHGQPEHHRTGGTAREAGHSSWPVLCEGLPDGIVTHMPDLPGWEDLTPADRATRFRELIAAVVRYACATERQLEEKERIEPPLDAHEVKASRSMRRQAWPEAAERAMAELGVGGGDWASASLRYLVVPEVLDAARFKSERERRLSAERIRIAFDPRRAPRVGEPLVIRIRRERTEL